MHSAVFSSKVGICDELCECELAGVIEGIMYNGPCYGYYKNKHGDLEINPDQTRGVEQIFDWYLSGLSVLGIITKLQHRGIPSPTGKPVWSKRCVDMMLSNEKYISVGNHPAIISKEVFAAVQAEKIRRTNKNPDGTRKAERFTSKREYPTETEKH